MPADLARAEELVQAVYPELRQMAKYLLRGERAGHTLQATALINEGLLRLLRSTQVEEMSRESLIAFAATQMRRALVDYGRRHSSRKRGGEFHRVPLLDVHLDNSSDLSGLVVLNDCLERLGALDPRALTVVELKFFAGCTNRETAAVLGISEGTVDGIWQHARLWLFRELSPKANENRAPA